MPLDNTASLNDIITALQTIEGINAKADLASVVGSPTNANDSIAVINSVIQNSKNTLASKIGGNVNGTQSLSSLVDTLFVGKKFAEGTSNSSSPTKLRITGLDFTPSFVAAYSSLAAYTFAANINAVKFGEFRFNSGGSSTQYFLPVFEQGSFEITVRDNFTYNWIAFE